MSEKALIFGDLSCLSFEDDFYAENVIKALKSDGWEVDYIRFDPADACERLSVRVGAPLKYPVCVVPNSLKSPRAFCNGQWKESLIAWVKHGGLLMFAGGEFNKFYWFDKHWQQSDYCRASLRVAAGCCEWVPRTSKLFTNALDSYNVKASLLRNVSVHNNLYSTHKDARPETVQRDMCAVAVSPFGSGVVANFSDVNAEDKTMALILAFARTFTQAVAIPPRKICNYCGKGDAKFSCGICHRVSYCSRPCKKTDMKLSHKELCQFEEVDEEAEERSTREFYRGMSFLGDNRCFNEDEIDALIDEKVKGYDPMVPVIIRRMRMLLNDDAGNPIWHYDHRA
mmetsp:Transcript_5445/g.8451  ORF Transcript_5445/g.8451 Transcript_5445/m.8451 type:complete len:340 (+) Transcript_5445:102-1121(+)